VGLRTVCPSFVRSTEGWLGGSTSFVVPMTGQDILSTILGILLTYDKKVMFVQERQQDNKRGRRKERRLETNQR